MILLKWCSEENNYSHTCQSLNPLTKKKKAMASVYKRKDGKGWRAVIRMKGYPTVCETFDCKQEADDWVNETERRIKLSQCNFTAHNKYHTYADLFHRMETKGAYALIHITPELIAKHSKKFRDHISERILKGSTHE